MIDNLSPCDISALVIRFLVATPQKQTLWFGDWAMTRLSMKLLLIALSIIFMSLAGMDTALATVCNGTNVLGTWHRHASGAFPDTATWIFVQDSTDSGTIQCSGDCIREGGRPIEWYTPKEFFVRPGMIKIRFEKTELIMGCNIEGPNTMLWTLDGAKAMWFERY